MNYVITAEGFVSELFQNNEKISVVDINDLEGNFLPEDKVYSTSDGSIQKILDKLINHSNLYAVNNLRDKVKFREILKEQNPNLYFNHVSINDIPHLELKEGTKYVIKPTQGFFATAIKFVDHKSNLKKIKTEIEGEINDKLKVFSEDTISKESMIVEDFIPGAEYACDMYYDENGEPVIMNISHHPTHKDFAYMHTLYYTNYEIFNKFYDKLLTYLKEVNIRLNAKSLPIHVEFKYHQNKIIPIEFNSLRFGGFWYADLTYHSFGVNPYEAFFFNKKPNWEAIWKERENKNFAWILCYNGKDINTDKSILKKNDLLNQFEKVLYFRDLDYKTKPVWGIAYVEDEDLDNLLKMLEVEFNDFWE